MKNDLILLSEYCKNSRAELDFLLRLETEGLIETETHNDIRFINSSQLSDLETFTHLYYELSINIEGIDVINNLLKKIRRIEHELQVLKRRYNIEALADEDIFDIF